MKNEMKLEFLSIPSNVSFAGVVVAAFATQLDPTIEEISEIKTAVSEAVTNSIIHAYGNGIVYIKCEYEDNVLAIKVTDKGQGISDVNKAREPLYTTSPDGERSGMGFTVMETFMDSVEVISSLEKGTTVIMTKAIGCVKPTTIMRSHFHDADIHDIEKYSVDKPPISKIDAIIIAKSQRESEYPILNRETFQCEDAKCNIESIPKEELKIIDSTSNAVKKRFYKSTSINLHGQQACLNYFIVIEEDMSPDCSSSKPSYGIEVQKVFGEDKQEVTIYDICYSERKINELADYLCTNSIMPISACDIVTDFMEDEFFDL